MSLPTDRTTPHWTAPLPSSALSLSQGETKKKKKINIKWDEETIAEHDKERGTRQKVDEAPTPYRYLSESEASESGSDGEFLTKRHLWKNHDKDGERDRDKYGERVLEKEWSHIETKLREHSLSLALPHSRLNGEHAAERDEASHGTPLAVADKSEAEKEALHEHKLREKEKEKLRQTESGYSDFGVPRASPRTHVKTHRTAAFTADRGEREQRPRTCFFAENDPFAGIGRVLTPERVSRRSKEDAQAMESERHVAHPADIDDAEGEPDSQSEGDKAEFKKKRDSHYNEFKMLQAMRAKIAMEEDDEDDD